MHPFFYAELSLTVNCPEKRCCVSVKKTQRLFFAIQKATFAGFKIAESRDGKAFPVMKGELVLSSSLNYFAKSLALTLTIFPFPEITNSPSSFCFEISRRLYDNSMPLRILVRNSCILSFVIVLRFDFQFQKHPF